jgi:hypothetical protein
MDKRILFALAAIVLIAVMAAVFLNTPVAKKASTENPEPLGINVTSTWNATAPSDESPDIEIPQIPQNLTPPAAANGTAPKNNTTPVQLPKPVTPPEPNPLSTCCGAEGENWNDPADFSYDTPANLTSLNETEKEETYNDCINTCFSQGIYPQACKDLCQELFEEL